MGQGTIVLFVLSLLSALRVAVDGNARWLCFFFDISLSFAGPGAAKRSMCTGRTVRGVSLSTPSTLFVELRMCICKVVSSYVKSVEYN